MKANPLTKGTRVVKWFPEWGRLPEWLAVGTRTHLQTVQFGTFAGRTEINNTCFERCRRNNKICTTAVWNNLTAPIPSTVQTVRVRYEPQDEGAKPREYNPRNMRRGVRDPHDTIILTPKTCETIGIFEDETFAWLETINYWKLRANLADWLENGLPMHTAATPILAPISIRETGIVPPQPFPQLPRRGETLWFPFDTTPR